MCIIFACHGKTPSEEDLNLGASCNKDGAGIAWIDSFGKKTAAVHWQKGLPSTGKAIIEAIEKHKITYPFVIHYRSASIGPSCSELTHPFPITNDLEDWSVGTTRRVLFHNGHIPEWKNWFIPVMFSAPSLEIPAGPWSDSRALAAVVNLKGEGILDFIRDSSRIAILDSIASEGFKKTDPISYIRTYGNWIEKDGWQQSCEYKPAKVIVMKKSSVSSNSSIEKWRRNSKDSKSCSFPSSSTENTYTVDELEELISTLKKEQDEARIMLGV